MIHECIHEFTCDNAFYIFIMRIWDEVRPNGVSHKSFRKRLQSCVDENEALRKMCAMYSIGVTVWTMIESIDNI